MQGINVKDQPGALNKDVPIPSLGNQTDDDDTKWNNPIQERKIISVPGCKLYKYS